jgi:hypothetical protein
VAGGRTVVVDEMTDEEKTLTIERRAAEKRYEEAQHQMQREYVESMRKVNDEFSHMSPKSLMMPSNRLSPNSRFTPNVKIIQDELWSGKSNSKMTSKSKLHSFSKRDEDVLSSKLLPVATNKASMAF